MLRQKPYLSFLPLLAGLFFSFSVPSFAATNKSAMVVTADPHATAAALQALEEGGNAVDAAVAAQWVLNVVEPQSSGLGGGGFFLYYEAASKAVYAFDGRETAPAEAFPEMFLDKTGHPYPFKPDRITGGLAVGVPGTLKLLYQVHARFGSKQFTFAELFEPAIQLASKGFPISKRLAAYINQEKDRLELFGDSRRIFLDEAGNAPKPDTILVQSDLAETFRMIQRDGISAFYEGKIADDIVRAVQKAPVHPGSMKKEDLLYYRVIERQPVKGSYRGFDVISMGPPSSGGTTLIETLHILEFYHLNLFGHTADGIHLLSEAQKLAFQDRDRMIGDPDFVKVPVDQLLSKEFAEKHSDTIRFEKVLPTVTNESGVGGHTSHISIVDKMGNMVAFTTTIEEIFGSGMVVPRRGFLLNNELTDFDAISKDESGKLVPNAPEGEKRPRSSMTPTFVFRDGQPKLIIGSPGGSAIIGTVLNIIVNLLDFDMSLKEAMLAPRAINRNGPLELELEFFNSDSLKQDLERRGHPVVLRPVIGNAQAIYFDYDEDNNQTLTGESDPRGEGRALGY